jgi:hypothetical protein
MISSIVFLPAIYESSSLRTCLLGSNPSTRTDARAFDTLDFLDIEVVFGFIAHIVYGKIMLMCGDLRS